MIPRLLLPAMLVLSACGARHDARRAYVYGYPLVLFDVTHRNAVDEPRPCGLGAPENTFAHIRRLPGPEFKAVVRPNVDTLYSSAFLDLSQGPVQLDMPGIQDRYVMMAVLDSTTENIAGLGTPTHGSRDGRYVLVGPDGADDLPDDLLRIDVPTQSAWLIGRVEKLPSDTTRSDGTVEDVAAIQDRFALAPLGGEPIPHDGACEAPNGRTPPRDVVEQMAPQEFFARLDTVLQEDPPPGELPSYLTRLGLGTDEETTERHRRALDHGAERAATWLDRIVGWKVGGRWGPGANVPLGEYGERYLVRSVVAKIGFGANRNVLAMYKNAGADRKGDRLDGERVYTLTFPEGQLPPVDAFWSLTVYGSDSFLALHASGTYAIGSSSELVFDDDGSLVVHLAHERPDGARNWLPVPAEPFEVTLRLYEPHEDALSGQWQPQELEPVR